MPVAVVTGASRGLGRQIAIALGKSGYCVAVNYLQSQAEAREVSDEIGENSIHIQADVSDMEQVEKMADAVFRKWGRVDALINNAGITRDSLLITCKEKDWDNILRTNLKGCFNTIKTFSRVMIDSIPAVRHIISVSSYSGLKGNQGQAAYSASKAGVIGLTLTAAKELAEHNICVNALLPGYMQTEMGNASEAAMMTAKMESITGKLSSTKDASRFIVYLLTTGNITGQVFCLDSRIM